jgi:1,2-phenylacetyl-CoA epoxidase catalytic subunit
LDHPGADAQAQGNPGFTDEAGDGLYLYAASETLGISRDELVALLRDG